MKPIAIFWLALTFMIFSCDRVTEKTREKIDSGAETVGKTATDIVNSIDKGITTGSAVDIQISESLKQKGLSSGKYYISKNDEGNKNKISIYLISDKQINTTLKLKLFDKKGVEMGRLSKIIKQDEGSAGYHDFVFDNRISIENQSKLTVD